ncbi:MAG: GNAT family N-acetyltransferase [Bdellovibrionales bacterium]|nr:GNAT family N-acetyltransferase [Bdellovibrionales bacterium]
MDGPRPPDPSEYDEVLDFLNHNLRPTSQWSIGQEYPTAFARENIQNIRIIKASGKIASHAVVNCHLTKTPAGIFKVGAIGSVVTDPSLRHQGLSKSLIKECLESARQQGCDFAVLWTHLYDFYRKQNFELAGTEQALIIEKDFSPPHFDLKFLNSLRVAPEALMRLYSRHTVGAIRHVEDIRRYLGIPNTHLYTAWDAHNNLKAYAVEGKGEDLNNYIHEWGGDVSSLLPLFAHIRKHKQKPITVICSGVANNLSRQLQSYGVLCNQGFLGMFHLLNPKNLGFKLCRYARQLGHDDLVFEFQDGTYFMGTPNNLFKTDSQSDIIKLVFGPLKATQIKGFDTSTNRLMERLFPLPFWIWGWDSI